MATFVNSHMHNIKSTAVNESFSDCELNLSLHCFILYIRCGHAYYSSKDTILTTHINLIQFCVTNEWAIYRDNKTNDMNCNCTRRHHKKHSSLQKNIIITPNAFTTRLPFKINRYIFVTLRGGVVVFVHISSHWLSLCSFSTTPATTNEAAICPFSGLRGVASLAQLLRMHRKLEASKDA